MGVIIKDNLELIKNITNKVNAYVAYLFMRQNRDKFMNADNGPIRIPYCLTFVSSVLRREKYWPYLSQNLDLRCYIRIKHKQIYEGELRRGINKKCYKPQILKSLEFLNVYLDTAML